MSSGMLSGLDSLETLNLAEHLLTTLPGDAFKHLPRPLTIGLGDSPLQCDAALCWLRQEELQGTIVWHDSQPICGNEIEWGNWSCDETGNMALAPLFTLSTSQHNYSICGRQTTYFVVTLNSDLMNLF